MFASATLEAARMVGSSRGPIEGADVCIFVAAHVVVVDETGQAWSWGNNDHQQLGHGDTRCRRIPTQIPGTGPGGHTIVMVSLGCRHTLLLTSLGTVLAFGDNTDGQCGQGEMKTKNGE